MEICGQLWLREMFLKAQTNIPQFSILFYNLTVLLICCSHLIATLVLDYKANDWSELEGLSERKTDKNLEFWVFHVSCIICTFIYFIANTLFLWYAFWEANRRVMMMRYLSNSIELDLKEKNKTTVRLPTLNFLDRTSLITWLEARNLIDQIGTRFTMRI